MQNLWAGTTLVQLFQRLGLLDLQDGHGMQGRHGLSIGPYKPSPKGTKNTYRPWTGVSGSPAKWQHFMGKDAPQLLSPYLGDHCLCPRSNDEEIER